MTFTRSSSLSNNPKILNNYLIFTAPADTKIDEHFCAHIVYCQQRLVRYNMFKDILRQLLKESENIIRIFSTEGLVFLSISTKRSRKGKYIISEKALSAVE